MSETIRIEVLFFARLRDLAGTSREELSLPTGSQVGDALNEIEKRFPGLRGQVGNCRVAVNEEFSHKEDHLAEAAVLALIPPVSGG